jgi:polyhydroxybutyrate depolymerase
VHSQNAPVRFATLSLILLSACAEESIRPVVSADAGADDAASDPPPPPPLPDAGEPITIEDAGTDEPPDSGMTTAPDSGELETPDAGHEDRPVEGCTMRTAQDFECTIDHDSRTREYLLRVPSSYANRPASGAALILNFHGLGSTPLQQITMSNMLDKSEAEGFIVVHPRGTGTILSWNAGFCCGTAVSQNVDDTGLAVAIVERIARALLIDPKRVYATGLSNGGHMAYKLACDRADVFAAVAPVAAVTAQTPCNPSRPIAVLHFHGTDDLIVGYQSGSSSGGTSAPETVQSWAERNGCTTTTTIAYQNGDTTCEAYENCSESSAAELCTIQSGGHTWPGGDCPSWLGRTTMDINATDYIWAFFSAHPLP